MAMTVNEQLAAAGGVSVASVEEADMILLVNNFDTTMQLEASQQVYSISAFLVLHIAGFLDVQVNRHRASRAVSVIDVSDDDAEPKPLQRLRSLHSVPRICVQLHQIHLLCR